MRHPALDGKQPFAPEPEPPPGVDIKHEEPQSRRTAALFIRAGRYSRDRASRRDNSSSEKDACSSARRLSSIWATELAPIMTDVTRLSRSSHAKAISARGLAALPGDFMQAPDPFRHPVRQHVAPQRALRRHARAFRNTVQVTVGQQPLCQRRKGHEPGPGLGIERQDADVSGSRSNRL